MFGRSARPTLQVISVVQRRPFDLLVSLFWSTLSRGPKRLTFYFQVLWASESLEPKQRTRWARDSLASSRPLPGPSLAKTAPGRTRSPFALFSARVEPNRSIFFFSGGEPPKKRKKRRKACFIWFSLQHPTKRRVHRLKKRAIQELALEIQPATPSPPQIPPGDLHFCCNSFSLS